MIAAENERLLSQSQDATLIVSQAEELTLALGLEKQERERERKALEEQVEATRSDFHRLIQPLQGQLAILTADLRNAHTQLAEIEAERAAERQTEIRAMSREEMAQLQQSLVHTSQELSSATASLAAAHEETREVKDRLDTIANREAFLKSELERRWESDLHTQQHLTRLEEVTDGCEAQNQALISHIHELNARLVRAEAAAQVLARDAESANAGHEVEVAECKIELNELQMAMSTAKSTLASAHMEAEAWAHKAKHLQARAADAAVSYCLARSRRTRAVAFLSWRLVVSMIAAQEQAATLLARRAQSSSLRLCFAEWKLVYYRRQAVRACLVLIQPRGAGHIALARFLALWRQQVTATARTVIAVWLRCNTISVRRKLRWQREVLCRWQNECDTFAHVTGRLLEMRARIQRRSMLTVLTSLRIALSLDGSARHIRESKGRVLIVQRRRRHLAISLDTLKVHCSAAVARRANCKNVSTVVRKNTGFHLVAALDAWCNLMVQARRATVEAFSRASRSMRRVLASGLHRLLCHAQDHKNRRFRHTMCSAALSRLTKRLTRERKKMVLDVLAQHSHSVKYIKTLLSISASVSANARPALLDTHSCVCRGKLPNHAFRLVSYALAQWERIVIEQGALREAMRRVLLSSKKNEHQETRRRTEVEQDTDAIKERQGAVSADVIKVSSLARAISALADAVGILSCKFTISLACDSRETSNMSIFLTDRVVWL